LTTIIFQGAKLEGKLQSITFNKKRGMFRVYTIEILRITDVILGPIIPIADVVEVPT
jgi:hypothetical protein